MVFLSHACKVCVESREVAQFINFYDPETKRTLLCLADYGDDDFTDSMKQRLFYKVLLNGTSHLHTVWLPFAQAVDSTKFNAFHRKLASWHTDLNSVNSLIDNLESTLRSEATYWPQPESVLSLRNQH